ncbi:MAG: ArnT family glycosyltransferase [Pyrinomonadaceae bacterium]
MPTSKLAKHGWKILFIAIGAIYLYGLGSLPLVGPDEPRYAQVAREMFQRGDFITPTLGGVPWFEKPPLLYWMMMASYQVFGVSEFAARLGPAICGLLAAGFVWWVGKNWSRMEIDSFLPDETEQVPDDSSAWSALVFASSIGVIAFAHAASFDIVVTMTLTGALACFFVWHLHSASGTRGQQSHRLLLAGFYCFVGLSLLAKGLIGLVIPLGVIACYSVMRREWPQRNFLRSLLWGLPLALAIAGLWYGPMILRHGWIFIDQFIIQHHFARFFTNKYRHPQPVYYYLPTLAWLALPWTMILLAAFISARRWAWQGYGARDRLRVFALASIVVPLTLFSLSGSKLPGYLLPVMSSVALLVGERLTCLMRDKRGHTVIRLSGALLILISCAGWWYAVRNLGVQATAAGVGALVVSIIGGFVLTIPKMRRVAVCLMAAAALIAMAVALKSYGGVAARDSTRDLMRAANARGHGSTAVFYMLADDRTAEFYAGGRLAYQPNGEPIRFDGAQQLAGAVRESGDVALVIIETRWETQLTDYAALESEKVGSNGWVSLFVVRPR